MNEDRILEKLDRIDDQGRETLRAISQIQEQVKVLPDHENRIRSLERWRWGLVGVSGLLTTAFTTYAKTKGV